MKNCDAFKPLIERLIEDRIDATERERLERHLQTCAACGREIQAQRKLWRMLGEMADIEPAPDYFERFRQRVNAEAPRHQALTGKLRGFFRRPWAVPAFSSALAALLVVTILSLSHLPQRSVEGFLATDAHVDMDLLTHMELVEDFEVINQLDLLSDLEFIERLNG